MRDVPGGAVSSRPTSLHGRRHEHQGSVPGVRSAQRHRAQDARLLGTAGIPKTTTSQKTQDRTLHRGHRPDTRGRPRITYGAGSRPARKQRHTAKRIHDQLRDEYGFDGRYTIVKDYVREHRRRTREMFVPLSHPPGHAQCDFGEALAVIGGVKRKVRSTSSSWTCPTAMPCSSGHTPPRPPRRSATDMCRRSRSWEESHRASCTTTPVWPLRGYWETVDDSVHACSRNCSPTTCSKTGSDVQARATTSGRWRVWSDTPGGTSWCPYLRSRASTPSSPPGGAVP